MRIHGDKSNYYPHLCSHCGKKFASTSHMAKHIRNKHTTKDSFKCEYCGKGTNEEAQLNQSTKYSNFLCILRISAFHQFDSLKKHIPKHLDRFICKVCGKSLSTKFRLISHTRWVLEPFPWAEHIGFLEKSKFIFFFAEFTQEKNRTNVVCAIKHFRRQKHWKIIYVVTVITFQINVIFAMMYSRILVGWKSIVGNSIIICKLKTRLKSYEWETENEMNERMTMKTQLNLIRFTFIVYQSIQELHWVDAVPESLNPPPFWSHVRN